MLEYNSNHYHDGTIIGERNTGWLERGERVNKARSWLRTLNDKYDLT